MYILLTTVHTESISNALLKNYVYSSFQHAHTHTHTHTRARSHSCNSWFAMRLDSRGIAVHDELCPHEILIYDRVNGTQIVSLQREGKENGTKPLLH